MFYYKTANGYESRNTKINDSSMQEITRQEYDEAMEVLVAEWEAEAEEQRKAKAAEAAAAAAEAADLAEALNLLGYKEVEN